MRELNKEEDYWNIRNFLRQIFLENGRHEISWQPARLDYWRWHVLLNCLEIDTLKGLVYIWEDERGQLAGVLNIEDEGEVFLQVHPKFKTRELEGQMIETAEKKLAKNGELQVWAHEDNPTLIELLKDKGYVPKENPERKHRKIIDSTENFKPDLASGYIIRSLGEREELPARAWASWRAFHPNEKDEGYSGWEWYLNIQKMPLYRRDLDLVCVSPEKEISGFCTIWFDDVTRSAYFEPVGIDPSHQRKGLGRALLTEGLGRLQKVGATLATVGGYSPAANGLYGSVMGSDHRKIFAWEKEIGFGK